MGVIKIDFFDKSVALGFSKEGDHFAGTDKRVGLILVDKVYFVLISGKISFEGEGFGLINELDIDGVIVVRREWISFGEEFGKGG